MLHAKEVCHPGFSRSEHQISEQLRLTAVLPVMTELPALTLYYRHLFRTLCRVLRRSPTFCSAEAPQTLSLTAEITCDSERLLSIVCKLTAQKKELLRLACVWSRQSGFPLPLSALSGTGKKNILAAVRKETAARLHSGRYLYYADAEKLVERYYSAGNYYVDSQGILLFYPPRTIASEIEGFPEFRLVFPASP